MSLLEEAHLSRSKYVQRLSAKTGCRNHDELWDHFFEVNYNQISAQQFIRNVAAYCFMARNEYTDEALAVDGTLAREQAMASQIAAAFKNRSKQKAPILVVTGGFHTAVLPAMLKSEPAKPKYRRLSAEENHTVLIRYSFTP